MVSTNIEPITFDNDKEFLLEYNEADDTYKIRVSSSNMYVYHNTDGNFYSSGQSSITNDTWKIVEVESWWAKDKIDKINFNFGQLSNGGMPGPMGSQGIPGETGIRGDQGVEGSQGPIGPQGFAGTDNLSIWKSNTDQGNKTLFPTAMQGIEYSAVGLITGKENDTSSDYDVALPFNGVSSTAAVFYGTSDRSNFALDNSIDAQVSGKHVFLSSELNIGESNLQLQIDFDLDNTTIRTYTTNNETDTVAANLPATILQSNLLKIQKHRYVRCGCKYRYFKIYNKCNKQQCISIN